MNHKKLRRLYREERLAVRRRGGRKRALGTRAPMALPQGPNQRWSLDFLSDAFADGRRFRILAIVDDFTRECLALIPDTSLPGLRVVRELNTGMPLAEICRKAGISQATYFNWKKKYDGLLPTEMRRLKQLEDENSKLKKLVAELSLDREMLQDVIRRKL